MHWAAMSTPLITFKSSFTKLVLSLDLGMNPREDIHFNSSSRDLEVLTLVGDATQNRLNLDLGTSLHVRIKQTA